MHMTIDLVPADLKKYVGMRFATGDQYQRAYQAAFTMTTECLAGPETPFGRMCRNGLLLNDETESFLYDGDFGFIERDYQRRGCPLLEQYIESMIEDNMNEGEKVIALSQSFQQELPSRFPRVPLFLYGESDEQTLLKGGGHCSCRARLLCALCQIIGIAARPVFMWPWVDSEKDPDKLLGGHTVAEVHIEGRWGYFDPQYHLYCRTADGWFPSIRDIRRNADLFLGMPASLVNAMQPKGCDKQDIATVLHDYWYQYLHPACPVQISRHDATDPYQGRWTWATPEFRANQQADFERNKEILLDLARRGQLTDAVYQLGLEAFRKRFGITQVGLPSLDAVAIA